MKTPTCPCCSHLYSVKFSEYGGQPARHPLLLRCGHTFCSACINKLGRKTNSIECPTCQEVMKVGAGHSLHKHIQPDLYTVGRMWMRRMDLEIQSEKIREKPGTGASKVKKKPNTTAAEAPADEGGVGCTECHINTAVVQCVKCDCVLCRPCFDKIHQMSVTLKKHQPVKLMASTRPDQQEKGTVVLPHKTAARHCATHDQCEIEYFCEDDEQAICSRCVILGDHKGHNVQTMEDKNKQLLSGLEPAVLQAQQTVWRLDKSLKVVQDSWPSNQHVRQAMVDEISSHFTQLHSLLQAREEQLVDDICRGLGGLYKPFQDTKSYLEQERLKLESALMDAARARHSSLHHVLDTDRIVDTLKTAKDLPCMVTVCTHALSNPLKFTCDQSLKNIIAHYGCMSIVDVEQMVSLSVPGPDAEKPPAEELRSYCVSDLDLDNQSNTDTASVTESVPVEEKEEEESEEEEIPVSAKVVKTRPLSYPPVKRLVVGHSKQVYVTHIRTPGQFYIHLASRRGDLDQQQRAIQSYCRNPKTRRTVASGLDKGSMVLAQFSEDKHWYRGRVIRLAIDKKGTELYDIFFVDYGNSELLPLQKLQKFQKRFSAAPVFAHECSLYDIVPANQTPGWTRESVETMVQMTCAGPLLMRVIKISGDVLQVDLGTAEREGLGQESCPVSVRDSLVFLQLAVFNTPSPQPSGLGGGMKRDYITLPRLTEGSVTDIGINLTVSPSLFYAQMWPIYQQNSSDDSLYTEECHGYLQRMLVSMQETYSDMTKHLYKLFCPRMDMMCVAKYHKDGNWYRARVTGLPGQRQVEVQFVDYGNKEIVAISDVCNILDDYLKYPMQALEVSLADVKPVEGGEWSEEANQWFRSIVELQLCQFRVTENRAKANSVVGVLYTMRSDTGELCCVNYELVSLGFAASTGSWSSEESFTGVTLASNMMSNLSLSSGTPSPLSGSFHLGSQRSVENNATSPSLTPCKPGNKRGQGAGVKGSKVREETSPGKGGEGGEACGVVPDGAVQVWISGYLSPAHFFIQLHDSQADLDSLMEGLQCYEGQVESDHQWKAGEFCAAKSGHDDRWYRGQILMESRSGMFEVRLVDYGHVDLIPTNQLRALHRRHGERECFAERCHLADLVPTGTSDPSRWSQTATELMKTMMGRNRLFVKLQGDRLPDLGLPVDILVEQVTPETAFDPVTYTYVSVSDTLQDKGLAMPVRRQKQAHPTSPSPLLTHMTMFRTKPHTTLPQCGILPQEDERSDRLGRECESGTRPALDTQAGDAQDGGTQAVDAQTRDTHIDDSQDTQTPDTRVKDAPDTQAVDTQPKDTQARDTQDTQAVHTQSGDAQPKDTQAEDAHKIQVVDTQAQNAPAGDAHARERGVTIIQPLLKVCPHPPPLSPTLSVLPVHVGPDGTIYAQDFDEETVIAALREDLSRYVVSEAPEGRLEVEVGHMCVAYFPPDQAWYRARVLHLYPEHVTVKYVDFGNSSLVEKSMLRLITPALCAQPQLAYEMKLHNVGTGSGSGLWPEGYIDFLNKNVLNVQCVANVEGSIDNHPLLVELYEGQSGQNVGRVMVRGGPPDTTPTSMEDRYQRCNDITNVLKKDNPYTAVSLGDIDTCVYTQVTHMDLPDVVYLQRCDAPEDEQLPQHMVDFVQMMDDLNSLPPQTPALSGLPSAGHACCARFSEDDRWYRALVIRAWTEGSTVLVYYVDYGNSEVLPLPRLRELPHRFLDTPAQAVQTHLHLALPAGCDRWSQETFDAMRQSIYMRKHRTMVKETKPVTVAVYQWEDGATLSYAGLVEQGMVALPSIHSSCSEGNLEESSVDEDSSTSPELD